MDKTLRRGNILRKTTLTVALLGAYGYMPVSAAINLTIETPYDLGGSSMSNSTVTVNDGGVATGDGTRISGSAYDVVLINSGGSLTLNNAVLSNNLDHPTGTNGRVIAAKGADATASLTDSTIVISAKSTNPGTDYNHAFTAGVAAADGGHVDLHGGSITASGSKRTVGMQANDAGSISATGVQITTNGTFGHAVQAYRTPTADETATHIDLDQVSITTHGSNYSVGIQSANKGASVTASDTDITTEGTNSFGVESLNGATVALTNGSITTQGDGAAGVRVYGGDLGSASATVHGTHIDTSGFGASGVLAGDLSEPTSGTANITDADITTAGGSAAGLESAFGSSITSTNSSLHTQGTSSHGVYAHDSGSATLNGDSVATDGSHSYGLYAEGADSTIDATDTAVTTNGVYGFGARAESGGAISLDGGSITTSNPKGRDAQDGDGSRAYALSADGAGSRVSTQNGTAITTQGQRAYGAYATNGAQISLDGGSVSTHGFMAYGLYASGAGSTVDANNVALSTSGNVGDGVWAYQGGVVNLNGGAITVGGEPNVNAPYETANGLVALGGDSASAAGTINANGVAIVTKGSNSAGALAGTTVGDDFTSGTINLHNSTVAVQGNNSVAASVNYSSTLTANNSTLTSQKSDGIVMTDNAAVNLTGTRVEAAHASLVSNLNSAGQQQDITVGSGSTLTQNNGTLLQVNRTDAGMDGVVNLTLQAGSNSSGDVIDLDGLSADNSVRNQGGKTNFTVDTGASWVGIIRGINDATTADDGSFVDNGGAPIAGNVTGGENSTIVFNNGATIAGGLSTGTGSQSTFSGATSIGGQVMGAGSALTFNGPTSVGQNVSVDNSQVTFGSSAKISQSVMGGSGSTVAFGGPATIGGSVTGGSGSSFVFAGSTTIGQNISGDGTSFEFSKGAPTVIGGNVELSQGASLKGGTTAAPIAISGNTAVNSGSTLGGNLFVQGALSGQGGTLSPGNSVGTQSYATSSGFAGAYVAEVNAAGQSDLIVIRNGNIDLAGVNLSVAQENGNGGYLLNHDYTIVQTEDGDVVNQFASETLDPDSFANVRVKLDPVKYGQKDVKVALSADTAQIDRSDWTSNQNAAYDGIISAGSANPLAFETLASSDMKDALNQLSGELHASTQSSLINSSDLTIRTLSNRMRANIGAGMRAGATTAQASGSVAGAMPKSAAYPLWADVVGNWSTLDGDDNTAKAKTKTGGLFIGGDTAFGSGWRVGGALGFTDSRVEVNDRSSKSDVTSYTAAVYGGNSWATSKGNVNLLVAAAYTHHNIDSRRTITVGGTQTLKADYDANTAQLFTELGYALPVGQASTVEPYLGVAWLSQRAKDFSETGGTAALQGDSQHNDVTTITLGLRGTTVLNMDSKQATLKAGLGWRHAAGDIDINRRMSFIQGNGTKFNVAGAPIAENAAVLDLGAEMNIGKTTALGVSYTGQFGDGNTDSTGSLYLKVRFD